MDIPTCRSIDLVICVLNYNGLALLKQYLPVVVANSGGYAIVLVDNGSIDGSVDYVQRHFPTIRCIVHEANYGVSKGYNLALKQIEATYYLLLNNDLLVTPDWLRDMLLLMESDRSIAFCQPKILSLVAPDRFDYAGAAGGFIDKYGYPFCRGRIFNSIEQDNGQYNDTCPIFWASGACLLVRSKAFYALGGFDELFFAHFDEIDLCWRAHLSGWKVYYCGTSCVYHLGAASLPYESPQKTYLNFRNRALMLYKYPSNHKFSLLSRMVLDGIAALRLLCLGKYAHCWAILKAEVAFFKWRKKCTRYQEAVTPLPHLYQGSIVVDFFIKNKKLFSDIF
ncbi:MAG: glycosyltransferase family 2 protein [Amoebophilaceae bacterium]|nr:glycosyltransferase family 2 protein [Amoebophilaceae bacterium]